MLVDIAKLSLDHPALMYTGPRKMLQDLTFEVHRDDFRRELITYWEIGYGRNKEKQLIRTYWNPQEAQRIRDILKRRERQQFTSVAMSMRNQAKDSRSMGWCMNSLVITRTRQKFESVEIQYRSSELTMKFGGDLCFLPWMFNELGLNPEIIRFRFANAYFSGVYLQYLAYHWPGGPVPMLEYIWKHDRKFFEHGTGHFFRSTLRPDQVFKYSPENLAHRFGWRMMPHEMKKAYRWLKSKYAQIGRQMPHRTMLEHGEDLE